MKQHACINSVVGSDLIRTEPIGGPTGQRAYLNGCLRVSTTLDVEALFLMLRQLEDDLGRERRLRWGARRIDLDLLLYGESSFQLSEPQLTVPHPRMSFRRFVLEPANQIASELIHPRSGLTIGELLKRLNKLPDLIAMIVGADAAAKFQLAMQAAESLCQKYGFQFISGTDELQRKQFADAKLLLCLAEDDSALLTRLQSFAGAILALSGTDQAALVKELEAALCAMQPLQL